MIYHVTINNTKIFKIQSLFLILIIDFCFVLFLFVWSFLLKYKDKGVYIACCLLIPGIQMAFAC